MKLPARVTRTVAMTVLRTKKNSPHIFFGVGVAGVIGSTVLACKATRKLDDRLEYVKKDMDDARALVEASKNGDSTVPMKEARKELSVATGRATLEIVKLYALPAGVGALSVACLAGSHIQLTRRNSALGFALTAMTRTFEDYRGRVREEVGEERENELYRRIETIEIKGEDGKKQLVKSINPKGYSIHAKCFDPTNPEWEKNSEINRSRLMAVQEHFNGQLDALGYVLLNDVYKALGFPRTSLGALYGWVREADKPGKIDFGIFETRNAAFVNGLEYSVWLDFNVDGVIYDVIDDNPDN